MILTNNKIMLIYGFNEDEKANIEDIIKENKLPHYKIIEKNMVKMTIKNVLEGLKFEIYNSELPEEKAILFNNFSDEELDLAIKNFIDIGGVRPILAVITPTSIDWTFEYLLEHLIEEREWFKKNNPN